VTLHGVKNRLACDWSMMVGRGLLSLAVAGVLAVGLLGTAGCGSSNSSAESRVGPEFSVTSALWDQTTPAISGENVIWQSDGEKGTTIAGASLSGGALKIAPTPPRGEDPAISPELCVWSLQGHARGGVKLPTSSIGGVSLSSHSRIDVFSQRASRLGFPTAALRPAVSGETVVWTDLTVARFRSFVFGSTSSKAAGSDIWCRNLASGSERPVCAARGDQLFPDIDGNLVVWEDWRHVKAPNASKGNSDIYGALLRTRTEIPICTKKGQQSFPAVSGTRVVWMDRRTGNLDIYGFNVLTGKEFPICVEPGDQVLPDISGNLVVWVDYRDGNGDVYGRDLSGGAEFPISTNPAAQDSPAVSDGVVVWADKRNGTWDIYGDKVRVSRTQDSAAPSQATASATSAPAPVPGSGAIPWGEADQHVGETVTIEGPVIGAVFSESSKGEPTFLNIGRDYPDADRVSIVIWGADRPAFPAAPESMYEGKTIRVTGTVHLYEGVPQVEVSSPADVEVVN
jgi:TolB protein